MARRSERDEEHQTARVWEADLGEAGRKLTAEELRTLEALHHCQLLGRITVAVENLVLHIQGLDGRFDRLERFLMAVAPQQYPESPQPTNLTALPPTTRRED